MTLDWSDGNYWNYGLTHPTMLFVRMSSVTHLPVAADQARTRFVSMPTLSLSRTTIAT